MWIWLFSGVARSFEQFVRQKKHRKGVSGKSEKHRKPFWV